MEIQKEPALNVKMRRDGTMTVVNVKQERTSTDGNAEKSKTAAAPTTAAADSEPARPVRIKKEKVDEPSTSTSKSTANKTTNGKSEAHGSKKNSSDGLNDSLEIIPMDTNQPIDLVSDDENDGHKNDGNKMPPPTFVPPAKPAKEKKAPAEKKIRSTRSKQTKRKVCITADI